ncbi:MAG: helix-turn-helix domain-containing protein, partial [bacterium]
SSYHWPGNVRQLLNVVQNLIVAAVGEGADTNNLTLDVRHIPDDLRASDDPADNPDGIPNTNGSLAGTSLEQLEKRAIRDTLHLTTGNREAAAKILGIGERTLYRKLKEYGLR